MLGPEWEDAFQLIIQMDSVIHAKSLGIDIRQAEESPIPFAGAPVTGFKCVFVQLHVIFKNSILHFRVSISNEVMNAYLQKLRYRLSEQHFKWFSISPGVVDERYGSFTAAWRFTRDQVPLPFDLTGGRAWFHDLKTSQVVSCGAGLDKRQCTLDIMFSGDLSEDQPAPAIIFKCVFVVCTVLCD